MRIFNGGAKSVSEVDMTGAKPAEEPAEEESLYAELVWRDIFNPNDWPDEENEDHETLKARFRMAKEKRHDAQRDY